MKRTCLFSLFILTFSILLGGCKIQSSLSDCFKEIVLSIENQGRVVARINGDPITDAECRVWLKNYPSAYRSSLSIQQNRDYFIRTIIRQKVMARLARQAGVDNNLDYFLDVQKYKEAALVNLYRDQLIRGMKLSDDQVLKTYYENPGEYPSSQEIAVSHIVLRTPEQLKNAMALLKAGHSFEEVAKKMSLDKRTATQGGSMGFLPIVDGRSGYEMKLLSMTDGQISTWSQSPQKFEIIRRDSTRRAPHPSLETLQRIRQLMQSAYVDSHFTKALSETKVEIDQNALNSVLPVVSTTTVPHIP